MLREDLERAYRERAPAIVTTGFMDFLTQEIMEKDERSQGGRFMMDGAEVRLTDSKLLRGNRIQFELFVFSINGKQG